MTYERSALKYRRKTDVLFPRSPERLWVVALLTNSIGAARLALWFYERFRARVGVHSVQQQVFSVLVLLFSLTRRAVF
jgi:hypothetical protein